MTQKIQFSVCDNCGFDAKCCKIIPPMIFEFERDFFNKEVSIEIFEDKNVPLLKKDRNYNCIFLKNNKCSIYQNRPFNCEFFPFDIKILDDKLYWIIWDFCYKPIISEINILDEFEKKLSNLSKREIRLYIKYTSNSDSFKDKKFKVLRKVSIV